MTLPPDPYTMESRLCDDDGMVSNEAASDMQGLSTPALQRLTYLDKLNNLRAHTYHQPPIATPFACTGHAHLAGEHIRCTSPYHERQAREQKWTPVSPLVKGRWTCE